MANDIDERKAQILLKVYKIKEEQERLAKLKENVDTILNKPKPNQWIVGSHIGRKNSEARASFKRAIVDEVSAESALYQSTADIERARHYLERNPVRLKQLDETEDNLHESQTASFKNSIAVANNATANKLSIKNEEIRQTTQLELDKKQSEFEIELQMERGRSEIKINEQREIKKIEVETHRQETAIDLEAGIVARLIEQHEVDHLTKQLFGYLDQKQKLLLEGDLPTTKRKITRLNKNIKKIEEAIDGRAEGLIQRNKRPELRGLEES